MQKTFSIIAKFAHLSNVGLHTVQNTPQIIWPIVRTIRRNIGKYVKTLRNDTICEFSGDFV